MAKINNVYLLQRGDQPQSPTNNLLSNEATMQEYTYQVWKYSNMAKINESPLLSVSQRVFLINSTPTEFSFWNEGQPGQPRYWETHQLTPEGIREVPSKLLRASERRVKTEQKAWANQIKAFIKTKTRSFDFEFRENTITRRKPRR